MTDFTRSVNEKKVSRKVVQFQLPVLVIEMFSYEIKYNEMISGIK